jgi:hypothetical protein
MTLLSINDSMLDWKRLATVTGEKGSTVNQRHTKDVLLTFICVPVLNPPTVPTASLNAPCQALYSPFALETPPSTTLQNIFVHSSYILIVF